jgi:hypothetical protein
LYFVLFSFSLFSFSFGGTAVEPEWEACEDDVNNCVGLVLFNGCSEGQYMTADGHCGKVV